MVKTVFRVVLSAVVVVAVGGFVLGWWNGDGAPARDPRAVGTAGMADRPAGAATGVQERTLTDEALAVLIKSRVVDGGVAAEGIQVRVSNGVVTLSGTVRSRADKQRAVQIVRETEGVHDLVADDLHVRR